MLSFIQLNSLLFNNKLTLLNKPKWLKLLLPNIAISFFHIILCDNIKELKINTLMHELTHTIERYNYSNNCFKFSLFKTIIFYVKYMLPQLLSLFSILAIYNLWFLLFLLFLLPLPLLSYFRRNIEIRGYMWDWYLGVEYNFSEIFNSWIYLKMDSLHTNKYYHDKFNVVVNQLYFNNDSSTYFKMYILYKYYHKIK